jgi:acetolactate synthase I/II/III large subunit
MNIVTLSGAEDSGNVSDAFVQTLWSLGVREAFGVLGGAIAPFCEAVNRTPMHLLHFRHEGGAAFAAVEASLASGRPTVVFLTSGPGMTNAMTGMFAARWEGARVLFVSGTTGSATRGRWAFQETSGYTTPLSGLFTAGSMFHLAAMVESAAELETIGARLTSGFTRPGGFVAHLGLPIGLQTAPAGAPMDEGRRSQVRGRVVSERGVVEQCAELLASSPFTIWLGHGARDASSAVRALAQRTNARVMCSPRGKGIFPEDDPLFLGVTGLGGHDAVEDYLRTARPPRTLVLGTRLGEFTSFYREDLVPREGFIHVDVDRDVFGAAYPNAKTLGVESDVGAFVEGLLDAWPSAALPMRAPVAAVPVREPAALRESSKTVRPRVLMEAIQRVIVEGSDAPVISEAGNSFVLATHHLRFQAPDRYRVSTGFGSMGHAVAGVIGMALARHGKAVAIAGDGAMLMNHEISTAVSYGVPAVWIVLNDSRYGMIDAGMRSLGWKPFGTEIPHTDFVAIARAVGADGIHVTREADLEMALLRAMAAEGPFVVDVTIDPHEAPPANRRNTSLRRQVQANDTRVR